SSDPQWIFVFLLMAGIGAGLMFVPSMMMAARMAPVGYNATVMSGFMGSGSLGFMLGPLAAIALSRLYSSVQDSFPFFWLTAGFGGLEIFLVLATIPLYDRLQRLMRARSGTTNTAHS
ncbi:MAG: hypothetical protein KDK30_11685, partial [Leptospiraceae bacterium]|nr:hypothetical protein [Leptospiraceae bacterium]